ncbi:MAG: hypothetical protein M1818_003337 [Claussenomyces sp. TS43310]|nr:MAG: hypothetical protein M1818_003337 [Claussenomyces sp. TS43310]
MDIFLGKITQNAMNYAIRSGIAITSSYALRQCSRLLKTVDDGAVYDELQALQERLDSKIRSPSHKATGSADASCSARGNTTLESAVSLTKTLRWEIQNLGTRLAKAATAEESSRREKGRAKTRIAHEKELRFIIQDIQKLLMRIEDAVPLINLAITTSGTSLSTRLPASVSPSRLLQASTLLTLCDRKFVEEPDLAAQVGPDFILSVYMLFAGHFIPENHRNVKDATWKEVVHKARVKLIRIPLAAIYGQPAKMNSNRPQNASQDPSEINGNSVFQDDETANDFAYQLEIIEDLDDGRVHSFEEGGSQPGSYKDVPIAGIREYVPIHEISKIFYADTGKILNIGGEGDATNPVLLLKRDVNALPPRRMMERAEREPQDYNRSPEVSEEETESVDTQEDVDHQLRRESSVPFCEETAPAQPSHPSHAWRFPPNLDPEWLALEVYTDPQDDSSDDESPSESSDSDFASGHPKSSREASVDPIIMANLNELNIQESSPPHEVQSKRKHSHQKDFPVSNPTKPSSVGVIKTSLSLLEMLIRLSSLQQFQQASHLSIPDELLVFFLEESSTTGAGGNGEERQRKRREAREKVGFDPYDDSPIKRRGESYQNRGEGQDYQDSSRENSPYDENWISGKFSPPSQHWSRQQSRSQHPMSDSWLVRSIEHNSGPRRTTPSAGIPSSPISPSISLRASNRNLETAQSGGRARSARSPLARGLAGDADSGLGTSPGTPTLSGKIERGEP